MATVQVRYIVHDVDAAIAFYGPSVSFLTKSSTVPDN